MSPRITSAVARTFRSLGVRNFRLFAGGHLVSQTGTWMQAIAQSWLVLQLTGSGFAVGVVLALQRLPSVLAGVWAGTVADRVDRRTLVRIAESAAGMCALTLGILTLTGSVRLWSVYLLAFLLGSANAFDTPARMSLVVEMVSEDHLPNATALNSAVMHGARILGPAIAGILIATIGLGWVFVANAASYLAFLAALNEMDPDALQPQERIARARGQIRDGLRVVWSSPDLRWAAVAVPVVATFGLNFQVLLPLMARFEFDGSASVLAVLTAVMGAGAVAGALATASRARVTHRTMAVAGTGLGCALVLAALAPTLPSEAATLAIVGAFSVSFLSIAHTIMQAAAPPAFRGRVLAIFATLAFTGSLIGGPATGAIAELAGVRSAMAIGGIVSAAAAAGVALGRARMLRRVREGPFDSPAQLHDPSRNEPQPGTASA